MWETYRMLGQQREDELLSEAARLHHLSLRARRPGRVAGAIREVVHELLRRSQDTEHAPVSSASAIPVTSTPPERA